MIKLLLANRADVTAKDSNGQTAHDWAAESRPLEVTRLLLRHERDEVDDEQEGTISRVLVGRRGSGSSQGAGGAIAIPVADQSVAVEAERLEKIRKRLNDIERRNEMGLTPLLQAAMGGDLDTLRELLEFGAALEAVNSEHLTALHLAVKIRHMEVITAPKWCKSRGGYKRAIYTGASGRLADKQRSSRPSWPGFEDRGERQTRVYCTPPRSR